MQHCSHELPAVKLGVHVHIHHLEVVEQELVCWHLTSVHGDLHVLSNVSRNCLHYLDKILGKTQKLLNAHSLSNVMSLCRSWCSGWCWCGSWYFCARIKFKVNSKISNILGKVVLDNNLTQVGLTVVMWLQWIVMLKLFRRNCVSIFRLYWTQAWCISCDNNTNTRYKVAGLLSHMASYEKT